MQGWVVISSGVVTCCLHGKNRGNNSAVCRGGDRARACVGVCIMLTLQTQTCPKREKEWDKDTPAAEERGKRGRWNKTAPLNPPPNRPVPLPSWQKFSPGRRPPPQGG